MPIIIENLAHVYAPGTPFEKRAIENINLTIQDGEFVGLIGHTGSGKSTLVQMFNGILRPHEGKVLLDGEDIWKRPKDIRKIRFRVGLVMQYPEYQLFEETIYKDIAYGPKNMGLSDDEIDERVREAADFAGLDAELLEKSPFDLSGGQKRRAAIAGIMAMRPEVLVLDEPAAGLAPKGREDIFTGLDRYRRESGATVIIVSHSMEDMALYCDRIIVMSAGRVAMDGTCAEVFGRYNELFSVGLDVPQITYVADALRRYGIDIGADIYTVKYAATQILEKAGKEGSNES